MAIVGSLAGRDPHVRYQDKGISVNRPPSPVRLPTLEQIAHDRSVLDDLPADVLIELRRQCGHLYDDLDAAVLRNQARGVPSPTEVEGVVMLEEAAKMLATSEDTLYSKWRNLPFAFKDALDGKIKFRVTGIARYIAGRTHHNKY
jgi:hypothetical protein